MRWPSIRVLGRGTPYCSLITRLLLLEVRYMSHRLVGRLRRGCRSLSRLLQCLYYTSVLFVVNVDPIQTMSPILRNQENTIPEGISFRRDSPEAATVQVQWSAPRWNAKCTFPHARCSAPYSAHVPSTSMSMYGYRWGVRRTASGIFFSLYDPIEDGREDGGVVNGTST